MSTLDLYSPKNGEEYDSPPYQGLPRIFAIIASELRSGSSVLLRGLEDVGAIWHSTEFFNKRHINDFAQRWGSLPHDEYLNKLMRHRTSPDGVFCIKVHHNHFKPLAGLLPDTDIRFIRIQRTNIHMQAISLFRARESQSWSSLKRARKTLSENDYDFQKILSALNFLLDIKQGWDEFFTSSAIPPSTSIMKSSARTTAGPLPRRPSILRASPWIRARSRDRR